MFSEPYFVLPATVPSGATLGETYGGDIHTYFFKIIEDETASVSVHPVTTPVTEAEKACFEVSSDAIWHLRTDFEVPFRLNISQFGGYLANPVTSIQGKLVSYADDTKDDETVVEKCLALDDDDDSEYDGWVTATLGGITTQGFTVSEGKRLGHRSRSR